VAARRIALVVAHFLASLVYGARRDPRCHCQCERLADARNAANSERLTRQRKTDCAPPRPATFDAGGGGAPKPTAALRWLLNLRHIPRQQEPVTESAMLAGARLSHGSVASAHASLLPAPQTPAVPSVHPARSGLRAKIARDAAAIEAAVPSRLHSAPSSLRSGESAPL